MNVVPGRIFPFPDKSFQPKLRKKLPKLEKEVDKILEFNPLMTHEEAYHEALKQRLRKVKERIKKKVEAGKKKKKKK